MLPERRKRRLITYSAKSSKPSKRRAWPLPPNPKSKDNYGKSRSNHLRQKPYAAEHRAFIFIGTEARESVYPFLEALDLYEVRDDSDPTYQLARFVQIVANFFGGTLRAWAWTPLISWIATMETTGFTLLIAGQVSSMSGDQTAALTLPIFDDCGSRSGTRARNEAPL